VIRKFFKDTALLTIVNAMKSAVALVMFPIYSRNLAVADYGLYDYLALIGVFLVLFVGLESQQGILRLVSTKQTHQGKKELFSGVLIYTFGIGVLTTMALILTVFLARGQMFGITTSPWLLCAAITSWLLLALQELFIALQRSLLNTRTIVVSSAITLLCQVAAGFTSIVLLKQGVIGLFLASLSGAGASTLFLAYKSRSYIGTKLNTEGLKEVFSFTLPLVLSSIAAIGWVYTDRLVVKHFLGLEQVGILGVGYRFAGLVTLLTSAISMVLSPLIYANSENEETSDKIGKLFSYYVLVGLFLVAGMAAYAPQVFRILAPPAYQSSANLLPLIAAAILIGAACQFFPGLALKMQTRKYMCVQLSGLLLNLILSLAVVKQFGVVGVTLASIFAALFVLALIYYFSQMLYPVPCQIWKILGISTTVGTMIAIVIKYRGSSVIIEGSGYLLPFFTLAVVFAFRLLVASPLR
jgi:O-antigen/teichoic acid export membrane protein